MLIILRRTMFNGVNHGVTARSIKLINIIYRYEYLYTKDTILIESPRL